MKLVLKTGKFIEAKDTVRVQGKTFPFCLLRKAWMFWKRALTFLL